MGDPTSSYATAGIALRVSGVLKPHHHDKVETPSVGKSDISQVKFSLLHFHSPSTTIIILYSPFSPPILISQQAVKLK
jgi:hypothetical protein